MNIENINSDIAQQIANSWNIEDFFELFGKGDNKVAFSSKSFTIVFDANEVQVVLVRMADGSQMEALNFDTIMILFKNDVITIKESKQLVEMLIYSNSKTYEKNPRAFEKLASDPFLSAS